MPQRPKLAGLPVAIHVSAAQFGQFPTVIDHTAGNAGGFAVRQRNERLQNGTRTWFEVRAHMSVRPFGDRPAVVAARLDAIDHFPLFPAHVPHPKIAGCPVKTHPPRIAQTKRINFRARAGNLEKRIVRRDRVRVCPLAAIDIDAQDAGEQVADVLAGVVGNVGRVGARAIPCGNIEKAVIAEGHGATVVTAAQPANDDPFARRINCGRVRARDGETRDEGPIGAAAGFDVTDEEKSVFGKPRMESNRVRTVEGLMVFAKVEHKVRAL